MAKITQYVATLLLVLGTLATSQSTDGPAPAKSDPPKITTPVPPTAPAKTDPPKITTPVPPKTAPAKSDPPKITTPVPPKTAAPTTAAPKTAAPPTTAPTTAAPTTAAPTAAPTTAAPTPAPANDYFYNITENNVTCIMIDGDFAFLITLDTNETRKISIPKHSAVVSEGTCNGTDGSQSITLTWGKKNSATLDFKMTKNMWNISSYTSELLLDGNDFKNTSVYGKNMSLNIDLVLSPEVAVNHSYKCISHLESNADATLAGKDYEYKVVADMDGMQIQAFNMIANEPDFVDATHCTADETSDIVPIAVGCALAGLVVVVLIAYLVGRRRRSAAYQSV